MGLFRPSMGMAAWPCAVCRARGDKRPLRAGEARQSLHRKFRRRRSGCGPSRGKRGWHMFASSRPGDDAQLSVVSSHIIAVIYRASAAMALGHLASVPHRSPLLVKGKLKCLPGARLRGEKRINSANNGESGHRQQQQVLVLSLVKAGASACGVDLAPDGRSYG